MGCLGIDLWVRLVDCGVDSDGFWFLASSNMRLCSLSNREHFEEDLRGGEERSGRRISE